MNSEIAFGNEKLKVVDKRLYTQLINAFELLESDAFSGIQLPKRLIPHRYFDKFSSITNLWKYNLPGAWRLMYTIKNNEAIILSVILEWLDHKEYDRRFNY